MSNLVQPPAGAADAPCAVCGEDTRLRYVLADGFVPVCSTFCEHAWPAVHKLYVEKREAETALDRLLAMPPDRIAEVSRAPTVRQAISLVCTGRETDTSGGTKEKGDG